MSSLLGHSELTAESQAELHAVTGLAEQLGTGLFFRFNAVITGADAYIHSIHFASIDCIWSEGIGRVCIERWRGRPLAAARVPSIDEFTPILGDLPWGKRRLVTLAEGALDDLRAAWAAVSAAPPGPDLTPVSTPHADLAPRNGSR